MEELKNRGWYLSENGFKCCIAALDLKTSHSQVNDIIKIALNHDLHHIGDNALPENISSGQCTFINGPIVLQVHKQSNISAPAINQESSSAPRLLKLTLTDGKLNCVAIEYSRLLDINTDVLVPGSKVCLLGSTNILNGVILLEHGKFVFLGGQVARLKEKWDMMKKTFLNRKINGVISGPPPFLEFDPTKINEIQKLKNGKSCDILKKQLNLQNGAKQMEMEQNGAKQMEMEQAKNLLKSGFTSLQTKPEKQLSAEKSVVLKGKKTVEKKYTRDLDYKPLDNKLSSVSPTQINNNVQSDKKLQTESGYRTKKEINGWKDELQPNNYSKHNPVKAEKKIEISLEDEKQNKYKRNNEKYHENHKKESFVCYDAKSDKWTTKNEEKTKYLSDTQKQEGGDTQKGFLINNFFQNVIPKDAETGCQSTNYSHGKDENIYMQSCSNKKSYRDQQSTRDSITYTQQNEKTRDHKKYTQSTDFTRNDRKYTQLSENARDDIRNQSSGSNRDERKYTQPSDNTQGDKKFSHSRYNTQDDKKFTQSRDNTLADRKYTQLSNYPQDGLKQIQSSDNTRDNRKYKYVSDISQDGKKYTQSSDNTRNDKNYKQSRDNAQDDRKKKQSAYNDQNNRKYSQQLDNKYKQPSDKTIQGDRKYIQSSGNRKNLDHKEENLPYTNDNLSEKDKKKDFQFSSHKQDLRTSSLKENKKYTQTTENIKNSGSRKLSQKDGEIKSWSKNIHDVQQKTAETEVSKDVENKKKERGEPKRDFSNKKIHPSSYKKDTSDRKFATEERDHIQQKDYRKGTLQKYEDENSRQINYKCDNQSKDHEKVRGEYKQNNSINDSKNISRDNFKKMPKERFDYKNDVQQVEKKVYPKTSVTTSIAEKVSDLSNLKRVSLEALFASASKEDDYIDSAVINQSVTSINDKFHFSKPGNLAAYQTAIPVSHQQHQMLMEQQAAYFQWIMAQQGFNPQFIQGIYQGSSSYYPPMHQDHNYYDENDVYTGSQYENENNQNLYH